jgi:NADH:ubiquinone oxidoreductase subunit 3 (subunit A)
MFASRSVLTGTCVERPPEKALYVVVNSRTMLQDDYMGVAVFAIVAILFPTLAFFLSRYFRTDRNDARSMTTYECGEVPIGDAQIQFHFQYYMYAIIFVAFDLVTVFVLIWALVFSDLSELAKLFMVMFLGVLLVGVTYALKKEEIVWI